MTCRYALGSMKDVWWPKELKVFYGPVDTRCLDEGCVALAVGHRGHTRNTAASARQLACSGPHVDPEVLSAPSSHDDLTMWL